MPSDPPLCVVTDDGCEIPEAERDRNLFTAGEWPHGAAATLDGAWMCRSGHLFRHLHVYNEEEKPGEVPPSKLWEALLRFPNAPVYGTHKKRKPPFVFTDEGSWPNFHTMRVLGPGVAPAGRVRHVYLLHNGLNETADLRFHYRLAAWILAHQDDAVCILRPLPGHLSRFAFHGPYAEQPLDVYLRDPADLFRQFLRHMLETQWLLSALVPRSSYAVMGGTRLLAEAEPGGSRLRGRADVAELARVMESEWEAAFKSAEQAGRVNPAYHKRKPTRAELVDSVSELRKLIGWRPQRSSAPPTGKGPDGVAAKAEPPAVHVVGYSMGGFMAQAAFFAWPFAISSCTNMFAGGALRDLAPTAFAHHEEWQAVLHGMRYELDVAFRRNFRLEDDDDAVRQDVSEPDWDADARAEEQTEVEQVEQESEYEDRTAGIREEDFAYFTRIFYEVYLQYYRGGYQSRVAEFSRRLLFVVGGDDPIVRTKNVLEAAPKGMTLLQIADVSHFPASRGRGPDGGKAETEQRKYWLPEIGRVIANFSERAEGLLANTLSTSWNAAAGAGRGPRSEASRLQPLEQAPEFLDSLAFAGELRRLVELIEPARRRLKGEPTGPGWLLISRNEVPPVFMGTTGFRFHGQAVHHAEQQIAEYVRTLHERARRIFRRRDRTTLLIPSAGDRWFWNTKFVSMSETPSAARVPDETNKRRMIAAFQRWVRSGVVREAVADEYAIPSERLGKLGDVVAAKIDTSRVSLTILPDVWIALSARVLKRLRGDVAEDDREENEQAIVKWARRLVPQAGDPLTELQEDLDSGDVLAITVSAAELSPRYRGRRLLSAKNVAAAIVHWALAYEASDVATRAPPMKTEKPPQPPPDALVAADGAQVDASPDPASGLALAIS